MTTIASEEDRQLAVEASVIRSAITGALIGAVICCALWVGIVALALAGKGEHLGPMLFVGGVCGIFAGIFLGGCAGSLRGAAKLEHHEHETLPRP